MKCRKILFLSPLRTGWKEPIEQLRQAFPNTDFITTEDTHDVLSLLPEADGIIPFRITAEQLQSAKKLKIIFIPWSGTDSLPMEAVRKAGCIVANTHGNASSVAEHAVTLALSAMHRIILNHLDLQKGKWHGFIMGFPDSDQWIRLTGKQCCVLGTGEIGTLVAGILHNGYQCSVVGWKKHSASSFDPVFDRIETDLSVALKNADIVFVTLPLTDSTKHLFRKENITWLHNKIVVNVGRALIFEESALYQALYDRVILYAGLDVWYHYPFHKQEPTYPSVLPYHSLPNVVISPHIGGYSKEGQYQMILDTMANIRSYLTTGKPIWQVQTDKGY